MNHLYQMKCGYNTSVFITQKYIYICVALADTELSSVFAGQVELAFQRKIYGVIDTVEVVSHWIYEAAPDISIYNRFLLKILNQ